MGQPLEVVVSELHVASARLADAGQRLQDGLSGVDLSVDQLLGSGWKGAAASAYRTEWDKWHTGAGQVIRGLQSMSEALKATGEQYAGTDQQGADALGSSMSPSGATTPGGSAVGGAPGGAASDPGAATGVTGSASGVTSGGQPGASSAGGLAQLMNLGGSTAQAGGQGLGQAGQPTSGFAQAAVGLARAVADMAQSAGDENPDDAAEETDMRPAETAGSSGDRSPTAPVDAAPPPAPLAGDPTAAPRPTRAE